MHLTEFYGSGIRRIRKECEINGNPFPTLANETGTFTTTYFSRQNDDSDTINDDSDTIKEGSDTIKDDSDTIKEGSDTIKDDSDTINSSDDTINPGDDTINLSDDTINPGDDTINSGDDTIKESADTIKNGTDVFIENIKFRILKIAKTKEGLKREAFVEQLSVSIRTVARALAELEKEGKIIHRGSRKFGGYYFIENKDPKNE